MIADAAIPALLPVNPVYLTTAACICCLLTFENGSHPTCSSFLHGASVAFVEEENAKWADFFNKMARKTARKLKSNHLLTRAYVSSGNVVWLYSDLTSTIKTVSKGINPGLISSCALYPAFSFFYACLFPLLIVF